MTPLIKNIALSALLICMAVVVYVVYSHCRCAPTDTECLLEAENTLLVGTNAEFAPFCFIEQGEIVGFDIDVVREVAQRLGKTLVIKDSPFEALLPQIQLGAVHVLAAGLTSTPERAERMLFTKSYIGNDPLVIVAKNKHIKTTKDLVGKQVAVNDGYTADAYISALPNVHVIRLKTPVEAMMALQYGRADAFVAARNTIDPILEKSEKNMFIVHEIPGTNENCALAVAKQYPELLPAIQEALDAMHADGTLASLKKKWGIRS